MGIIIPDRTKREVLIDNVLYAGETGIFDWDGYINKRNQVNINWKKQPRN